MSDYVNFLGFISSLFLNIIFGAISVLIGLYLWGLLLTFIGEKIGGKGIYKDVVAVIVWSIVPLLFMELFYIMHMIIIIVFPEQPEVILSYTGA